MKFLSSQIAYLFTTREMRGNLRSLLQYLALLAGLITIYAVIFHLNLRIVSRITHERNVEAIHRAGADFVLSYASLGANMVFSLLRGHDVVVLGEGVDLFALRVPSSLAGRTIRESAIGSRTGLSVVAVRQDGQVVTQLSSDMPLATGAELVMFGSLEQRRAFGEAFE